MIGPEMERKVKEIARVNALRLGCRNHPQLEDIISEGVLGALTSLKRVPEGARETATTAAWVGAREGIIHFLRSPQNLTRKAFPSGNPTPEIVSWDAWIVDGEAPAYLKSPDFAPLLINRLWREAFWAEFWAGVYPAEAPLVKSWLFGDSAAESARRDGSSKSYFQHRLNRVFNRFRRRYGLPETDANTTAANYLDATRLNLSQEDEDLRFAEEWLENRQGWVYCRTPKRRGGGKNLLIRLIGERMTGRSENCFYLPRNGDHFDLTRENIVVMTRSEQKQRHQNAKKARDPEAFRAKERERYARAREKRRAVANARYATRKLEKEQYAASDAP